MTRKEREKFVDKLEDEICKRTDIDSFDYIMVEIAKELYDRYLFGGIDDTKRNSLKVYINRIFPNVMEKLGCQSRRIRT